MVYANKPFIFTFLFELHTDSLAWDSSVSVPALPALATSKATPQLYSLPTGQARLSPAASQIYDLVWDPKTLTIHSTIPNIPTRPPQSFRALYWNSPWTRVEALNTHTQLLNTYAALRHEGTELERTIKTSRGWWGRMEPRDAARSTGAFSISIPEPDDIRRWLRRQPEQRQ